MRQFIAPLRILALLAMVFWLGGFTFYSAVVIPTLHGVIGVRETGLITQQATNLLNLAGTITLGLWWLHVSVNRDPAARQTGRLTFLLLALDTLALLILVILHPILDHHVDSGNFHDFYPKHRIYLITSTLQWGLNLALMAVFLVDLNMNSSAPEPTIPPHEAHRCDIA